MGNVSIFHTLQYRTVPYATVLYRGTGRCGTVPYRYRTVPIPVPVPIPVKAVKGAVRYRYGTVSYVIRWNGWILM